MFTHEVVKAFDADRPLRSGEKVDASGWRNTELLVKQGHLKPLPLGAVRAAAEPGDSGVLMGEVLAKLKALETRVAALEGGAPAKVAAPKSKKKASTKKAPKAAAPTEPAAPVTDPPVVKE